MSAWNLQGILGALCIAPHFNPHMAPREQLSPGFTIPQGFPEADAGVNILQTSGRWTLKLEQSLSGDCCHLRTCCMHML